MKVQKNLLLIIAACSIFMGGAVGAACRSNSSKDDGKGNNASSGDVEPTVPSGFMIAKYTDGIEIEGISTSFFLSAETPSINLAAFKTSVYLTASGVRIGEVPKDNFIKELYYGNAPVDDWTSLTADGKYALTVTVVDAYYSDGSIVGSGAFTEKLEFTINNPFVEMRLKAGSTEQTASATDKLSAGWVFEGIRANGEREDLPADCITYPVLDTLTIGEHSVSVSCGELGCTVKYTIMPRSDIIKSVKISLKESVNLVADGESVTLGTDDFNVVVVADGAYALIDSWLIYEGQSAKNAVLAAREEPHELTFSVCFEYVADGDRVTKEYSQVVEILVERAAAPVLPDDSEEPEESESPVQPDVPDNPVQPEEPDNPIQPDVPEDPVQPEEPEGPIQPDVPEDPVQPEETDGPIQPDVPDNPVQPDEPDIPESDNLIMDGTVMDRLSDDEEQIVASSAAGNITLVREPGCLVTVVEDENNIKAVGVVLEAGVCYTGVRFTIEKSATVSICLSSSAFSLFGVIDNDENLITELELIESEVTYHTSELEAGDYCFLFMDVTGASSVYIYSIEIIMD